ncbi:MAG: hypothetical protein V1674_06065 [Candidatus Omnitrophota bacterium]
MKKVLYFMLMFLFLFGCQKSTTEKSTAVPSEPAQDMKDVSSAKEIKVFNVYQDKRSPDNHFIPSGWMGDYQDVNFNDAWMDNPHGGSTCIKITYSNKATSGARWVGMYWQEPANNWGNIRGGFNLSGYTKLTFWARGHNRGERIEEFKVGGITGEFSDSDAAGIGPVVLEKDWKRYEIDLTGKDLSHIIGGFCWSTNLDVNPEGAAFYLDDIRYVK